MSRSGKKRRPATTSPPATDSRTVDVDILHARSAIPTVVVALAVLLLVAFGSMVFGGAEPVAVDTAAANAHKVWLESRWDAGEFPEWYPDILLGMPSYPSFVWTPASPLSWVHTTFDLNRGGRYVVWLFAGGVGAFFLFRRWGASVPAAFVATVSLVFTPYIFGLVNAGHSSKLMALAFAPLVWLAVESVVAKRSLLAVGLAAWAIALQLWANHPQIVFYTWLLLGPYVVLRWWFDDGRTWRAPAALAAAFALAALMVALPYGPVQAYSAESTRGAASVLGDSVGSGTQSWEYATAWSFHPRELISLIFPSFFGLQAETYWGFVPFTQSSHSTGTVAFLLAVLGVTVTAGWRRWFLVVAAAVVLVIGFGRHFPILYAPLYNGFPFFDKFRVPSMIYAMLPLVAAFAMLPALDKIANRSADMVSRSRLLVVAAFAFGVSALIGLGGFGGLGSNLADMGWFHKMFNPSLERPSFEMIATRRALLFSDLLRGSLLALVVVVVAMFRLRGRVGALPFWGIVLVLLGIDLFTVDRPFYNPEPKSEAAAISRVSDTLASAILELDDHPRVLPIELVPQQTPDGRTTLVVSGILQSNDYGFHRIGSVGGYHPASLRRMKDFTLSGAWRNPALWRGLGIDAVVFHARVSGVPESFWEDLAAQYPETTLVHHESGSTGAVAVLALSGGLGDAYVVAEPNVVSGGREQLLRVSSETFDPAREAIVDAPVASGGGGEVTGIVRADERVEVSVSGGGGLLVLTDAFATGWTATVDGAEVGVVPVNHVLRGVPVTAGDHRVVFEYRDTVFERSRVLHNVGRVLALLAIVVGLAMRLRRRDGAVPVAEPAAS
jgi:hypothetical protein